MSLPIRVFWLMNSNIGRLLAEKDLRELTLLSCSESSEGAAEVRKHLNMEMGDVGSVEEGGNEMPAAERDQQGVDELKALMGVL